MLFSSVDKSSKYTANNYGLNTPLCLIQLVILNRSDKYLPHFICIIIPCTNVSIATQSTLALWCTKHTGVRNHTL